MKLKYLEIELLNNLFEMRQGVVLDFSDRTINLFFADEMNIDFDDDTFRADGGSKANRLRCFIKVTDRSTVITVLVSLWNYKKSKFPENVSPQDDSQFAQLIQRLQDANYEESQGIKPALAYVPQVDIEYFKRTLKEGKRPARTVLTLA